MSNISLISALRVVVYGLYLYVLHQIVFFVRFGALNTTLSISDLFLIGVGILSILLYVYFARNSHTTRKNALRAAFVLSIPFSFFGTLAGGLLGNVGILIYGLIPSIVCLWGAHLLFKHTQ